MRKYEYLGGAAALLMGFASVAFNAAAHDNNQNDHPKPLPPLTIKAQGAFAAGGTVLKQDGTFDPTSTSPVGMTLYGDHSYVEYQIPVNPRKYPLVMWHGGGQMAKTWQSTVDGREGYQSIFLRRNFSVYLLDQPRRGRAGNTTVGLNLVPTPTNETLFMAWRLGVWPKLYPNSQFPPGPDALNQFWRQMTPDTGPGTTDVVVPGVVAAIDKIGESVILTHSASGLPGWLAATKTSKIKGIYAYEPTDYVFPAGNVPAPIGGVTPNVVPVADFLKLTKIPIVIEYSDGIPAQNNPSPYPRVDLWRNRMAMGMLMRDTINRMGGHAQIVHLPDYGLHGNTHFSFADLNNLKVADLLSDWLHKNKLDVYPGYSGH